MMKVLAVCVTLIISCIYATPEIHFKTETIKSFELYTMMVSPDLFNWTSSVIEEFR